VEGKWTSVTRVPHTPSRRHQVALGGVTTVPHTPSRRHHFDSHGVCLDDL